MYEIELRMLLVQVSAKVVCSRNILSPGQDLQQPEIMTDLVPECKMTKLERFMKSTCG